MLSLSKGSELVRLARNSIKTAFENKKINSSEIKKYIRKQGVFVTLHAFPSSELRGCIGFIQPALPLGKAILDAARAAAFSDPRFMPLQESELDNVIIEISVLTEPEEISVKVHKEKILKEIRVGADGLIVSSGSYFGLLLPQVAVEQGWQAQEFLENTCMKAGLNKDAWKQQNCRILKFQAQIFSEVKPKGKIIEKG